MNHIPGSVDTPIVPGSGYDSVKASRLVNEVNDVAAMVEQHLAEVIVNATNEIDDICSQVQGQYAGAVGIKLDEIDATCNKVRQKLADAQFASMTRVYTHVVNAGFNIPTVDNVHYFKASGDVFGSMGLGGPVQPIAGSGGSVPAVPVTLPQGGIALPQPLGNPGTPGREVGGEPNPQVLPVFIPSPLGQPLTIPPLALPPNQIPPVVPPSPGSIPPAYVPPPLPDPTKPPGPGNCPPAMMWFENPDGMGGSCQYFTVGGNATGPQLGCPPGQIPNPNYNPEGGVWSPVEGDDPYGSDSSADGTPCALPTKIATFAVFGNNNVVNRNGELYWAGTPPQGLFGVPEPKSRWDVVCITPLVIAPPAIFGPQICVYVPAGDKLFQDPSTGFILSAPTIPPWGCPLGVSARRRWVMAVGPNGEPGGGEPCIPDPNPQPQPPEDPGCEAPGPICIVPKPPKPIGGLDPDKDPCKQIEDWLASLDKLSPNLSDIINVQGAGGAKSKGLISDIIRAVTGGDGAILPQLINRFAAYAGKLIKQYTQGFECDRGKFEAIAIIKAGLGFIQKWTGVLPEQITTQLEYFINTVCQYVIPSASEADRAFLAGTITEKQWICYTKAAGLYVDAKKEIRDAGRTRVNPHEVIQLLQRKYINDDDASKRLRNLGVLKSEDEKDIRDLATAWPTFTDVIRFMVRDVFDEQAVSDSGFDEDFDAKYTDEAKKYGDAQGLSKDVAKLFWRAHWQMPSYTAMREMIFRLRPDKYPNDMAFTTDQMEKTLKQDDWAPAFVKRMVEIAYRVITPGDAIQMYQIHLFDEDQLRGYFLDNGYKPDDADLKTSLEKRRRELRDLQTAGYPTMRRLQTLYANCQLDDETFVNASSKWANSQDQMNDAFEAADIMRQVTERKNAIKNVQKAYQLGLIDDATAASDLNQIGIDPGCIPALMKRMKQQKQKGNKHLTASQLCKMRDQNIITEGEQIEALQMVGWTYADAYRIATSCQIDNVKRHDKKSRSRTTSRTTKTTGGKTTTTDQTRDQDQETLS